MNFLFFAFLDLLKGFFYIFKINLNTDPRSGPRDIESGQLNGYWALLYGLSLRTGKL